MASRNAQCAMRDQAILSRNSTNTLDNVPNTLALGHIGHTVTGKRYLNQFPDILRGDHTSCIPRYVFRGIFRCIRAIRHQSNAGYTSKLTTYYIIARNEYLCANIIVINSENRRNHRHLGRFQVKFNFLLACVSRQGQYI